MLQKDFFRAAARLIGEAGETQQALAAGKPKGLLHGAWLALRQRWLAAGMLLHKRMIGKQLSRTS